MRSGVHREFDPANDTHYAISEEAELRLKVVSDGAQGMAQAMRQLDPEHGGLADEVIAAMLDTVAFAIDGAISDRWVIYPGSGKRRRAA